MRAKHNLKRNKRILQSLLELRRPHRRMQYCQKPTVGKMAKWWLRRMRKREEKRLERLEKSMAKAQGIKKKKMTQREMKQQKKKDVLAELSKEIKAVLPHFRMLYRAANIEGPTALQLQQRKHIKKRRMLALFKKENKILSAEINFLFSPSVELETQAIVVKISNLTQEKMFWDHVFNDVKALLRLLTIKIAENGTVLDKLTLKMHKTYFNRTTHEKYMITKPAYFGEIEYHLYPEKRIHKRKSIKDCYLEDLAEIENLFMELDKRGEEFNHYLRTRQLFVAVLDKIVNRLNRGKKIVLDFLQDGHNIMNTLTMRIIDLISMKKMSISVVEKLEARKRQAQNERAILIQQTKDLMSRHRPSQPSETFTEVRKVADVSKDMSLEEVRAGVERGYEVFLKAVLVVGGQHPSLENSTIKDFTTLSQKYWIPQMSRTITANAFLMQKISFPMIEANDCKKQVEMCRKSILEKKQKRRDLKSQVRSHRNKLEPILMSAREAKYEVRKQYLALYKTCKYFMSPLRDMYSLLNRKPNFNANKLGIHSRMTEYNRLACLKILRETIPYCVAKLVHAEKNNAANDVFPFNTIIRYKDTKRLMWQRYQFIKQLIRPQTELIRKRKCFKITDHPPLYKSPCPLCCVEERLSKMAIVEEFEDHIRSMYEIQCELRDTQELEDLKALNHPIWECVQPAARSLIQLLILEDRTRQPGKIMDFTKMAQ